MEVEVKIDAAYLRLKAVIFTFAVTEEVRTALNRLAESPPEVISGTRDGKLEVLEPEELIRIYACAGRVFAATSKGEYALRFRLYEAEARLDPGRFVRISNSEIVNLRKVKSFDLSFTGTICVELEDGAVTYVSRRYVSKLKKILGV